MGASAGHEQAPSEGRIARSWRLSRIAWRVVRSDRAMLSLALLSALLGAAGLALIYDLNGLFSPHRHAANGRFALTTLILAYPLTFLSVFFNTAIAAAAFSALDGERLTLREALSVPFRRLGQVALWSLLASVIGVIVEQVASRLPFIGSVAVRLVGLSWSLASMFAVPLLATEGCSAPHCLTRSAALVKKRWGEGISGNVIITAWTGVAMLPVALLGGIGIAATRGHADARIGMFAAMVILMVLIAAASGVIRQTFAVVLYRYATDGAVGGGFSQADLTAPFSAGMRRAANPAATQPRRLPSRGSLWAWALCLAVSAAVILVWELNRHHFAAHRLSARVFAAVALCLMLAALLRLLVAGVTWLARAFTRARRVGR